MVENTERYTPDPEVVDALARTGEGLFQYVCRQAESVKARELETGSYLGDGPTAAQADSLIGALRPLIESPDSVPPAVLWNAFRAAVDTEMCWLFPERDTIGNPMTAALREVQNAVGWTLNQALPENAPLLERYANLAVAKNAVRRQTELHGNSVMWRLSFTFRMAMARFLWWLGGGGRHR